MPEPTPVAERRIRPLVWRLPLIFLLIIGVATLLRLDRLLVRDYGKDAASQALQIDALLESFIGQRIALLGSARSVAGAALASPSRRREFESFVREITADAPDVHAVYLLNAEGNEVTQVGVPGEHVGRLPDNHLDISERAPALREAIDERRVALTGPVRLRDGQGGMLIYLPVVRQGLVKGVIAASVAYQPLFNDALAEQLQGRFAYRLRDQDGDPIAITTAYPARPASLMTRDVDLAGTRHWTLDVAVPGFQPLMPRLITWSAGIVFLILATVIVLREEARAARFGAALDQARALSSDLLDANLRLEERSRQLAEANRAKSRFLANVSHELRTPLNAIVGYNSLALDGVYGELPDGLQSAQERIRTAAEHLLAVVNDVLDLSKIEVGRMEVDVEPLELSTVVDSVVTVLEPIAEAKGIRLDVFVAHGLPVVLSDPRHLRQILMNLVSNAIKFTHEGSVTVIARRSPAAPAERMQFVVQDTGIGIPPSELPRIFEEFEQVRPSGRGDSIQRGTGLGLAIARKLTQLLDGSIEVESRVGQGSRFVVDLPIRSRGRSTDGDGAVRTVERERPLPGAGALADREETPPADESSGEQVAFGGAELRDAHRAGD